MDHLDLINICEAGAFDENGEYPLRVWLRVGDTIECLHRPAKQKPHQRRALKSVIRNANTAFRLKTSADHREDFSFSL